MRLLPVAAICLGDARPASAEWTFGGFLGGSWTRETSLTLTRPSSGTAVTLSPVHYDGKPFQAPPYYGYRAGLYPASGWFGVEAELIHLKVIADTQRTTNAAGTFEGTPVQRSLRLSEVAQRFSITHGVNLLLVNALVRRTSAAASGRPRWIAIGRAGAGASVPHPESTIGGRSYEAYEWGSFALQGSGAVEVRIARALYVSAEYKITRTTQHVTIDGGTARTPLITQHLTSGVALHLGS
ncbi:MAG TPA: hypothetical protein VFJ02_15670 [Vicinamibacterales bacterium]|nr:hypothetical protein [Vicinamibacterales bacterium]